MPDVGSADAKIGSLSSQQAVIMLTTQVSAPELESGRKSSQSEAQQRQLAELRVLSNPENNLVDTSNPSTQQDKVPSAKVVDPTDTWCNRAKGSGKALKKAGEAFTLP